MQLLQSVIYSQLSVCSLPESGITVNPENERKTAEREEMQDGEQPALGFEIGSGRLAPRAKGVGPLT
jgi:hypothetical protein